MQLTRHQKQIVRAIIAGDVYDIFSYLSHFKKLHLCKHDIPAYEAKFRNAEQGRKYKVITDRDKVYIKSPTSFNTFVGPVSFGALEIMKDSDDIPCDAWEEQEAKLIHDFPTISFEYRKHTFEFDFWEDGVYVVNDFSEVIDFMTLWSYLKQEGLVIEVPRDISSNDLGILFEAVPKPPKPQIDISVIKDLADIDRLPTIEKRIIKGSKFLDHPPIHKISSYADYVWEINREHLANCDEFIGKKILPTSSLRVYSKNLFLTSSQRQFWATTLLAIAAIIVSIVLAVCPSKPDAQIEDIQQQIFEIREAVDNIPSSEALSAELDDIQEAIHNLCVALEASDPVQSQDLKDLIFQLENFIQILLQSDTQPTE